MEVDVIVMVEGGIQSIMDWQLRHDSKGELRALYADGRSQPEESAWEDLAVEINRRAFEGDHTPVELFIYLRDGLDNSIYDYRTLQRLAAGARDHAWGGKLYIVWDKLPAKTFKLAFGEAANQILLAKCFCAFLHEGVTNLIELTQKRPRRNDSFGEKPFDEKKKALRGAVVILERRLQTLRSAVTDDGWGYVLRNDAWLLETLLSELGKEGCLPSGRPNHIVLFDASPRLGPKELLDKFDRVNHNRRGLVGVVPEADSEALEYQCQTAQPPLEILHFNGIFEAVYGLLQLNKARKHEIRPEVFNPNVGVEIESIEVIDPAVFHSSTLQSSLRLLITSAHHPTDEPEHSIAAANEVGAMLRALPFHLDVEVYPSVICESLPKLLESRQFAAWIHISHAKEKRGLYEAKSEGYALPERWLTCFAAYKSTLQLALFSSCESAEVARLFAAAGVGVAVGFRNEVLVEATRILAERVVQATMQAGSDQDNILLAFRYACERLAARTTGDESYIDALPVAFSSIRKAP
jgi:hypothetical protein